MTNNIIKLIVLSTILLIVPTLVAPTTGPNEKTLVTFKINGTLIDYQWAHHQSKLAILSENNDQNASIHIIDADRKEIINKIDLPVKYQVICIGWLRDDSGFMMSMSEKQFEHDFYTYRFKEGTIETVSPDIERLYYGIYDIVFDGDSDYWAVTYAGEGHPDIAVYHDRELVLHTDVHPSFIQSIGWRKGLLYCETGAFLEMGLTREQRDKHPKYSEQKSEGRDESFVYTIDPIKKEAVEVSVLPDQIKSIKDIVDKSTNGYYLFSVKKEKVLFLVTISAEHK